MHGLTLFAYYLPHRHGVGDRGERGGGEGDGGAAAQRRARVHTGTLPWDGYTAEWRVLHAGRFDWWLTVVSGFCGVQERLKEAERHRTQYQAIASANEKVRHARLHRHPGTAGFQTLSYTV